MLYIHWLKLGWWPLVQYPNKSIPFYDLALTILTSLQNQEWKSKCFFRPQWVMTNTAIPTVDCLNLPLFQWSYSCFFLLCKPKLKLVDVPFPHQQVHLRILSVMSIAYELPALIRWHDCCFIPIRKCTSYCSMSCFTNVDQKHSHFIDTFHRRHKKSHCKINKKPL